MKKRRIEKGSLEKFGEYLRNEERSAATVEKYMRDAACFVAFIGRGEVCRESVLEYKTMLGSAYAVASANSMIAAVNCFLRFSGLSDMCVKQFKMQRKVYCPEEKELTREEYFRLLKSAGERHNERLNLVIQTICATGIRVSELQYITVESLAVGEAVVSCKGKNRRIFIVPELKRKLACYVRKQHIKAGSVFVTRSGKPLSRNNIWREMKSLCKEAGVAPSKVFPHNLRHLFARTFWGIEKDIAKLADILGHASIETTRIYIVTTGKEHRQKMENMRLLI